MLSFITHNDARIDAHLTSLQGYIQGTIAELSFAFGAPDQSGSADDKVTTEWMLRFEDGRVATIYDWKTGYRPAPTEVYDWHIGGRDRSVVELVHEAFRAAKTKLQDGNRRAA